MIRIEDKEDFEAYKDAKAELDDEFKELEEVEQIAVAADGDQHLVDDQDLKVEEAKVNAKEHQMDTKNASGLSKQIKRNEEIDWRNIEQLN